MEKNEKNEEGYDMCQAIRELEEEARSIGFAEGKQTGFSEGRRTVVRNMLMRGMADDDIMAIAECDKEFINEVRMDIPCL